MSATYQTLPSLSYHDPLLLTLRQTKDVIAEIISARSQQQQAKRDKNTLNQFMLKFFNQRYGLKHLTIGNAKALLKAIQRFSASDVKIDLFGKILLNVVDEGFLQRQQKMSTQVEEVMKMCQRERMQHASKIVTDATMTRQLADMLADRVSLEKCVVAKAAERLYPQSSLE